MARRIVIVAVATLQIAVSVAVMGWQAGVWSRDGWAGFAYQSPRAIPGMDLHLLRSFSAGPGQVSTVAPGSPAARAGIVRGDTVVSIDGVPTEEEAALGWLDRRIRVGRSVTYRIRSGAERRDVTLVFESPYRSPYVIAGTATSFAVGVAFLLIGLMVVRARGEDPASLVFSTMCAVSAELLFLWGAFDLHFPSLRGTTALGQDPTLLAVLGGTLLLSIAVANLLLHLGLVFPRPRPILTHWPEVVAWLHTAPFLPLAAIAVAAGASYASGTPFAPAAVTALGAGLVASSVRLARRVRRLGFGRAVAASPWSALVVLLALAGLAVPPLRPPLAGHVVLAGIVVGLVTYGWILVSLLAYSVATCVVLARAYREGVEETRHQLRWPLWGTMVGIGGSLLAVAVTFLAEAALQLSGPRLYTATAVAGAISKLLYVVVPLSFGFAILKVRLPEVDALIRRTVVYLAMAGFVVAGYLVVVGAVGPMLVRSTGISGQAVTMVATLVVALGFVPVRSRVQRVVERHLFRRERI